MSEFSASVRSDGGTRVLVIEGDLTLKANADLRAALQDWVDGTSGAYAIALDRTTFIDSAGLGLLLIARDSVPDGARISLRKPQAQAKRLFELSQFDLLFDIED